MIFEGNAIISYKAVFKIKDKSFAQFVVFLINSLDEKAVLTILTANKGHYKLLEAPNISM